MLIFKNAGFSHDSVSISFFQNEKYQSWIVYIVVMQNNMKANLYVSNRLLLFKKPVQQFISSTNNTPSLNRIGLLLG